MKREKSPDSGGIRTHASEETGALNQRLRPLGHAILVNNDEKSFFRKPASFFKKTNTVKMMQGFEF